MKKVQFAIITILSIVLIQSCEKARQRIIRGQIIDKETKQPISDAQFKLIVSAIQENQLSKGSFSEYVFTTSKSGQFEVMFESKTKEDLVITYPNLSHSENSNWIWSKNSYNKKDIEINTGTIEASEY